ncbi:hypothetical protein [Zobellia alginiliquefaciens]|uniref:hypothetical protein n=1 Tax=Zobellia alginiliquefaciens TaxID=3032586 RepID=UPI0023E45FCD|nr:hypothetical protein [Zobellia alginiliquefaciens]
MEQILTATFPKQEDILTSDIQLQRLDRNLKDISQLYAQLSSYISEPKTYDQFLQLDELKEDAKILRNNNRNISSKLRQEPNMAAQCYRLFLNYLIRFESFANKVDRYLNTV